MNGTIIAVEEHWGNPETEKLRDCWIEESGLPGTKNHATRADNLKRMWDFDSRIPMMNELGIKKQILSLSSPGVQGIKDRAEAAETARRLNQMQFELMNRFPGRFLGYANLPMLFPDLAAEELDYCMRTYGYVGGFTHGHCYGKYFDDPSYDPFWEVVQAHHALIYIHITDPIPGQNLAVKDYPLLNGPCWSWGVEAATHALRLMTGGVFDRFPDATVVLGHMGEGLPYLLGRLNEGTRIVSGTATGTMKKRFEDYMRENIYITTSGGYYPETMHCAIQAVGIDRIFYADDYPFANMSLSVQRFMNCGLAEEDQNKILYQNILNAIHERQL